MKTPWEMWKEGFYAWEKVTASYMEEAITSPVLLRPAGKMLGNMMRAKAASDEMMANVWSMAGLPTRRDQERMMHTINQLQSRLIDLEEQLADAQQRKG